MALALILLLGLSTAAAATTSTVSLALARHLSGFGLVYKHFFQKANCPDIYDAENMKKLEN